MAKEKVNKKEIIEKIEGFFRNIQNKTPEEIRKIKRIAMHYNLKLGERKKKFCKFCFSPKLKVVGIKHRVKKVLCEECGKGMGWKLK